MNIAYKGTFLREGLLLNGHQVHDLTLNEGGDLQAALKAAPFPVDLVIWELFGGYSNIHALAPCEQPLVGYCIDTPLNEFWIKNCAKNFDHVFVDQPQCVPSLAAHGIEASWLPLPAKNAYFQPPREKKHTLTFIGSTTAQRLKRTNLLRLIRSRVDIHCMSGLDVAASQKIFSQSRIILNENYFPGLTLRVLQGLSAGSIVFTEQSPYGHDFGLEDGRDLVTYTPHTVLERLAELVEKHEDFAAIGLHGQETCRRLFSSGKVAAELLARVGTAQKKAPCGDDAAYLWNQAAAELLFVQRFGGSLGRAMRRLGGLANSCPDRAAAAHVLMGDVEATLNREASAREHYRKALEMAPDSTANLKLAFLDIRRNEPDAALRALLAYLHHAGNTAGAGLEGRLSAAGGATPQALLLALAGIYLDLGRPWDMGFHKDSPDPVPDTALAAARLSWECAPSSAALELMLQCLRPAHMEGELLPTLLGALKMGLLSPVQILDTARLAYEYYDRETAAAIMSAMKKAR
ncbi:MAG: hypothetical protein HDQ89_00705 [Desulfovibrio sp.]|nr:hypothetical protein [Desulfovibrio sp.]